jgi:hypothetical protein
MSTVLFTAPRGVEWQYEMSAIPRIGEHVAVHYEQYLVVAVLFYPETDIVRIRLEHLR